MLGDIPRASQDFSQSFVVNHCKLVSKFEQTDYVKLSQADECIPRPTAIQGGFLTDLGSVSSMKADQFPSSLACHLYLNIGFCSLGVVIHNILQMHPVTQHPSDCRTCRRKRGQLRRLPCGDLSSPGLEDGA